MSILTDLRSELDDIFFDAQELAECLTITIDDGTGHEKDLRLAVLWQGDLVRDTTSVAYSAAVGDWEAILTVNAADFPRRPCNDETIKVNGKKWRIKQVATGPLEMYYVLYLCVYTTA